MHSACRLQCTVWQLTCFECLHSAVWDARKNSEKRWNQNQSWNKTSLQQFKIDMTSLEICNFKTVFWLFASWISFPKGSPTIKSGNWSTYISQDQRRKFAVQPYNSNRNNDNIFVQNKVIYYGVLSTQLLSLSVICGSCHFDWASNDKVSVECLFWFFQSTWRWDLKVVQSSKDGLFWVKTPL